MSCGLRRPFVRTAFVRGGAACLARPTPAPNLRPPTFPPPPPWSLYQVSRRIFGGGSAVDSPAFTPGIAPDEAAAGGGAPLVAPATLSRIRLMDDTRAAMDGQLQHVPHPVSVAGGGAARRWGSRYSL
jgi:hypothetical protein